MSKIALILSFDKNLNFDVSIKIRNQDLNLNINYSNLLQQFDTFAYLN